MAGGRGIGKHELSHASRYNRYDEYELPGWLRLVLVLLVVMLIGGLAYVGLHSATGPSDLERVLALAAPFLAMVVLGLIRAEASDGR